MSQHDEFSDESAARLELPKTRLSLYADELIRFNKTGGVVLRLPLDKVESIEVQRSFDPGSVVVMVAGVALGTVGYFAGENKILSNILYAAAVIVLAVGALAVSGRRLIIVTKLGVTKLNCLDQADEVEGFVQSMRHVLQRQ